MKGIHWFKGLSFSRIMWQLAALWLCLRVITSIWAAFVSPMHPDTLIEQEIALWPPSESVAQWGERAFLAPWERRDAIIYKGIVTGGYLSYPGSMAFHPLFPWLAVLLNLVVHQPLFSLLIVSSVAGLAYLLGLEALARFDSPPPAAQTAALLMLFSPLGFILFAAYSESLFLLCGVLSFIFMRRRAWWLAGLAGGLAALTRQQGVFLALPLAWEMWEAAGRNWRKAFIGRRDWLALGLIPLGFLIWILYRAIFLSDLQPDFSSLNALVYTLIISPNVEQVVPGQMFMWPWQAFAWAVKRFLVDYEPRIALDLLLGLSFLGLTALAWPRLRISYRLYVAAIVIVSFSYHTGSFMPYMSLPRHLFLAFPVFIGLGPLFQQHRIWSLVVNCIGLVGFLFFLQLYIIRGWIP